MKKINKITIFILINFFLIQGCSNNSVKELNIRENNQELELYAAYNEAYKALNEGDPFFAAKKFLEAELLFPQSVWAPKSALLASYSYYLQNFYSEALANLERYLTTYPKDKNLVYAHYLIAMCYYETIEDEKRDTKPIIKAKEKFEFIVNQYPNTEFSLDSNFKLDLIEDLLASKEMYIGRHYLKKKKWIAATNRFKIVINDYENTLFVEEALHRLVEIYFNLGLKNEAQKYANILGYNYLSSEWYEKSYKIFNKNYLKQDNQIIKNNKKSVLSKFKILFE